MYDCQDLEILIRSGTPMLFCASNDERRILGILSSAAEKSLKDAWRWSCVEGLCRVDALSDPQHNLIEPEKLLLHLRKLTQPGVFSLLDFHHYLSDPKTIRLLKDIALDADRLGHTLVFISHEITIPPELSSLAVAYHFAVPSVKEITAIVRDEVRKFVHAAGGRKVTADPASVELLIQSLLGLPEVDIRRLARAAIHDDAAVTAEDVTSVMQAKRSLLQRDGVLEFSYDTTNFDQVAGLHRLKEWLDKRKHALHQTKEQKIYLAPPKGLLLLGVQGCGKSLAAKAVAGAWKLPLLRLDMSAVFNKFMGDTERRMRDALKNAEALAPCVLWIDEIEKGLSSTDFDGGTAQRVLGSFLTWMAERTTSVFLVATANSIDTLPPELLRKGRFDEIFFVDLPSAEVREELFRIHMHRRGMKIEEFSTDELVQSTHGFSGAEIEQLLVSALYAVNGQPELISNELLLQEAAMTQPLSRLMAEEVSALRDWAKQRCVMAD